jgi:hypothetical protein
LPPSPRPRARPMREAYYDLRCLECGNDSEFWVSAVLREGFLLTGTGEMDGSDMGGTQVVRVDWNTLQCNVCGSNNVQRKRRYRTVKEG